LLFFIEEELRPGNVVVNSVEKMVETNQLKMSLSSSSLIGKTEKAGFF
jgi:hypothetical protein